MAAGFTDADRAMLKRLAQRVADLNGKVDILMSQQDEVNADVAAEQADIATIAAATPVIQAGFDDLHAQIAALQNANPALDLTGLAQVATDLHGAVGGVVALQPPPAPAT